MCRFRKWDQMKKNSWKICMQIEIKTGFGLNRRVLVLGDADAFYESLLAFWGFHTCTVSLAVKTDRGDVCHIKQAGNPRNNSDVPRLLLYDISTKYVHLFRTDLSHWGWLASSVRKSRSWFNIFRVLLRRDHSGNRWWTFSEKRPVFELLIFLWLERKRH